jgi:hypothetical protein
MKKFVLLCIAIAAFGVASALPGNIKVFNDTYKLKSTSKLGKAACGSCHASAKGGKLNPYGKDIQKEMVKAKTKKMTSAHLKKVEVLDSDKDGCINLCEIKNDRNPGVKDKAK